jgi:hypothetical protein
VGRINSTKKDNELPLDGETKLGKFERIAQRRVTEVVSKIRLIGNLSDKKNYEYTDEHVRQIFEALESELRSCKAKFRSGDSTVPPSFSFKR